MRPPPFHDEAGPLTLRQPRLIAGLVPEASLTRVRWAISMPPVCVCLQPSCCCVRVCVALLSSGADVGPGAALMLTWPPDHSTAPVCACACVVRIDTPRGACLRWLACRGVKALASLPVFPTHTQGGDPGILYPSKVKVKDPESKTGNTLDLSTAFYLSSQDTEQFCILKADVIYAYAQRGNNKVRS